VRVLPAVVCVVVLLGVGAGMAHARTSPAAANRESKATLEALVKAAAVGWTGLRTCQGSFRIARDDHRAASVQHGFASLSGSWKLSGNRLREEAAVRYSQAMATARAVGGGGAGRPPAPTSGRKLVIYDGTRGVFNEYISGQAEPVMKHRLDGLSGIGGVAVFADILQWLPPNRLSGGLGRLEAPPSPADDLALVGHEVVSGVATIKIVGRKPRRSGESRWMTWWIAPQYGGLVMRRDVVIRGPRPGMDRGEYWVQRRVVKRVKALGQGVYAPVEIEQSETKIASNGAVTRVYERVRFVITAIEADRPIPNGVFKVPPEESAAAGPQGVGGCAYNAIVDLCRALGIDLSEDETTFLAGTYRNRGEASFADMAADLSGLTRRPMAGFRGDVRDMAALGQPVIAQLANPEGMHFVVVESVGEGAVRLLDGGAIRAMGRDAFEKRFTGMLLAVDPESLADKSAYPRVACADPIVPETSAVVRGGRLHFQFAVSNTGTAPLHLRFAGVYPGSVEADASIPPGVPAGGSASVGIVAKSGKLPAAWAVLIRCDDQRRPVLWLGGFREESQASQATLSTALAR
jgi:hypothetical protein